MLRDGNIIPPPKMIIDKMRIDFLTAGKQKEVRPRLSKYNSFGCILFSLFIMDLSSRGGQRFSGYGTTHNRYLIVPNKNHPILHGVGWFFVKINGDTWGIFRLNLSVRM
jgi:hypothetical protein